MRRPYIVFPPLLILFLVSLLPLTVVYGQLPQLPHTFFGEAGAITINGEAPNRNDLILRAEVEGVDGNYSIPIEPDGSFGGPGFYDPKLKVGGDGNEIADGASIEFFVTIDGEDVGPIAVVLFGSGKLNGFKSGDLNVEVEAPTPTPSPTPPSPGGGGGGGGGGAGGGGGGGILPTRTPTPGPTAQGDSLTPEAIVDASITPTPTLELSPTQTAPPTPTPEGPSVVGGAGAPTPVPPTPPVAPAEISPTSTPEPAQSPPLGLPPTQSTGGIPWWGWALIGLGAAAIAGGGLYYLRLRSAAP